MTPEQFVYWLKGFVELSDTDNLNKTQWRAVKNHLAGVMCEENDPLRDLMKEMLKNHITQPVPHGLPDKLRQGLDLVPILQDVPCYSKYPTSPAWPQPWRQPWHENPKIWC